jgi:DNA helicase-2/ATP-dependent DNA helicase PcrA
MLDIRFDDIPTGRDIVGVATHGTDRVAIAFHQQLVPEELTAFRNCWTVFKRKGLGESLLSFRNAMALGQLADDPNPHALTLSTVHTMKGLEKDIVFLTSMCEGVFPDYRANTKKEIDEERNSAFVAVTRARRWIFITFPQQRKMPWGDVRTQSPSRFLQEMNAV